MAALTSVTGIYSALLIGAEGFARIAVKGPESISRQKRRSVNQRTPNLPDCR